MCISSKPWIAAVAFVVVLWSSLFDDTSYGQTQQVSETEEPRQLSPDDIRDEFAALKKEDVAWRKIPWKTCLLDGLNASQQQQKPILLWIFIDRPIDDERC